MPLPKRNRVEAKADPLAKAADPLAKPEPAASGSALDRARNAVEAKTAVHAPKAPQQPKVNRKEQFGGAYDPSMKPVHFAHRGGPGAGASSAASKASLMQLFGTAAPSSVSATTTAASPDQAPGFDLPPAPTPTTESASADALLAMLRGEPAPALSGAEEGGQQASASWWAHPALPRPQPAVPEEPQNPAAKSASDAPVLRAATVVNPLDPTATVPDVEPWDEELLAAPSYDLGLDDKKIDGLIHHIPHVVGWNPPPPAPPMKLVLTPAEMRRQRHISRVNKAKEAQQNEHLGLAEKPEQKWTLKHLEERQLQLAYPSAGPTELEQIVREQIEKRVVAHYEANETRHLAALGHQKDHYFETLERKASESPRIVAYRIDGIHDEYLLNKIKINAKERLLRGVIVWLSAKAALVVLVGGEKAQRRVEAVIRNAKWPAEARVDRLWCSNITETANDSLFFQKARAGGAKESGKGSIERVRLVKPRTARDALELLSNQGLQHIWLAAVSAPVLGELAFGVPEEDAAIVA